MKCHQGTTTEGHRARLICDQFNGGKWQWRYESDFPSAPQAKFDHDTQEWLTCYPDLWFDFGPAFEDRASAVEWFNRDQGESFYEEFTLFEWV